MKKSISQRVVIVSRQSALDALCAEHGTRKQAEFFLGQTGQSIAKISQRHEKGKEAMDTVLSAVPKTWRRARVMRQDLSRFLFEPNDIVVVVGQDGLVANVAKYMDGQRVIGVNPDPQQVEGVLVRHRASRVKSLLPQCIAGRVEVCHRAMAEVVTEDGQRLRALNEIFVGHQSHQSARYQITRSGESELQSSSGLIVATGTGATGWAKSIALGRSDCPRLPAPTESNLVFLVRECFASITTGTSIVQGTMGRRERLRVVSRMNEGGVIFGDGIEDDRIHFGWGTVAEVFVSAKTLHLVH